MTPQGYPLWAVNEDGTPFLVVGWEEMPYGQHFPLVVSLDTPQGTPHAGNGEAFTFTTTDPRNLPDMRGRMERELRARLANLADAMESHGEHDAARGIRQELNR